MKNIAYILIIILLASCSGEKTAEQINAEITRTRGEIAQLNQELADLEQQLAGMNVENTEKGIPVVVDPLMASSFTSYITTSGTVEAANAAMVSPEMNGRIKKIHVTEGQKVNKGQLLVTLDSEVMQKGLDEMETGIELAKTLYEKQDALWKQGVGSELQYLEAKNRYESLVKTKESMEAQLKMAVITAPFSGYVEEIFQKTGELATPGRQILQLVNMENLHITTELSEVYINSIHQGDTAHVTFPDIQGLELAAPVSNTGNTINTASRTFNIRINAKNKNELIKPNMLARLTLQDYHADSVMVVPTQFIRQDLQGDFVYLAVPHDGDYFASKTYVTTGRSDGERTVIEEGLRFSDLVIVKGYNQIKDGSKLNITQKEQYEF